MAVIGGWLHTILPAGVQAYTPISKSTPDFHALCLIQIRLVTPVCEESLPLVKPIRRRCEWPLPDSEKRSQLFIGMHNKPLSIVAMCVSNPDRLSQFPE
jgi:hypothetical protein